MKKGRVSTGLVFGMLAAAVWAQPAAAQAASDEIASGTRLPLAAGKTFELRAINGEAAFVEAQDEKVLVEYVADVPADLKVVALTSPDGITVCTVYPSPDPKKPTECLPGGKGRLANGKIKDRSKVRFTIHVPAGVHVKADIINGNLKSTGITGNVRLDSNNGDVLVHDAGGPGTIDARVGLLGNVDVVIAAVQKGPALRLVNLEATGSGRVRVAMPTTVTASYNISTQQAAVIDKVFRVDKVKPPILSGYIGAGANRSDIRLMADTGIAGQFTLVPAK